MAFIGASFLNIAFVGVFVLLIVIVSNQIKELINKNNAPRAAVDVNSASGSTPAHYNYHW